MAWYECKVKYIKVEDTGKEKKVSEPYLVDAVSFTEAEARITEEMEKYISGEFKIVNIRIANFAEILTAEHGDRWYKAKVALTVFDEDKGTEKKSNQSILVQASDVKDAFEILDKTLSNSISDYSIPAIAESPILDIFPVFDELDHINEHIPDHLKPVQG